MPRAYDAVCMKAAIDQAVAATAASKMPFGAVLVNDKGEIICSAHNMCQVATKRGGGVGDSTRHAEMELIRKFSAAELPNEERSACTLYTSTEPCVMCAGAIYWSGVGRVVYGCSAEQLAELSGPGGFDIPVEKLYGMAAPGSRTLEVEGPCLAKESLAVHAAAGVWKHAPKQPCQAQAMQDIAVEASLKDSGLGSAAVVEDGVVPVIDMSKSDEEITKLIWEAANTVGFFSVINHGIDQALIDSAFSTSATFFEQPLEDKKAQSPLDMSINSGYEYFSQVRPSTGVADQKESLQITARSGCMDGRWPNHPGHFETTSKSLLCAAHGLANRLLALLEPLATPHLQPGTLAKSHKLWTDQGQCTLRYLHYPAMAAETTAKLLQGGYWRAGPHTDWDSVTILFQQLGGKGLECCANPRTGDPAGMYWTAVNPVQGAIAVNVGDMLSKWSDGRLYSNLHRVRLPVDASKPRYSIAYFQQADKDVLIESKESDPITAGDYILSRIRSNFSK